MRNYFEEITRKILSTRRPGEHFLLSLVGERSQFIRVNQAKVRQSGLVEDASLEIVLLLEGTGTSFRRGTRSVSVTGLIWQDWEEIQGALKILRQEVPQLPKDPYAEKPQNFGNSVSETTGDLLPIDHASEKILEKTASSLDLAGIYAAGPIYRGMANSEGQLHWFSTETFSFDYSLYTQSQRALKGTYAGTRWNQKEYEAELEGAHQRLSLLEATPKKIARGEYRTYLAPAALAEIVNMLSWGGVSEASLQQGDSPFRLVRSGQKAFSPQFTLLEDFSQGQSPRFNDLGEISPECLPLIDHGVLKNTLISSRTAKEYQLTSNAADSSEALRAPVMGGGDLEEKDILRKLDTGLYLSNLHYLNWSDQPEGRMTGMTRYACFWVENGKVISPIEDMRWDDSLFSLLGTELEALTRSRVWIPEVMSYEHRALGGMLVPGALLKKMKFTI